MARRDEEEPEELDKFIPKRVIAYFIDQIFTLPVAILVALGLSWGGPWGGELVPLWAGLLIGIGVWGFLQWLFHSIMEGLGKCTIGERVVGIELALLDPPEDVDAVPVGAKAFIRNFPKILGVVGGIANLVVYPMVGTYFRPYTYPDVIELKPKRAWTPPEDVLEEDMTLREDLPFPEELMSGHCPKCGTPYRLDTEDGGFSGLWNYRCTWCNYPVFEHWNERRTMPGFM